MSLKPPVNPPAANRVEKFYSAHGEQWADHYAWLRAENWQEVIDDPSKLPAPIADYLKAENEYYDLATAGLAPLRNELVAEMRGRMEEKHDSLPARDGPYKYYTRRVENTEHGMRVRTDLNGDAEQVVFDVNAEAHGFAYFAVRQINHSPDHRQLLWTSDTTGAKYYTLHIRDIATGLDKNYVIENVEFAFAIAVTTD